MKTIEDLRNSLEDKVYVSCGSRDAFDRFLADAEKEGCMIGEKKPTEAGVSWDIKAIEYGKKISNVGTMGHMAYQAGAAHVVDYEKYISGDEEYEMTSTQSGSRME